MATPTKMCDICHLLPATEHTIYGATGQVRSLCVACMQKSATKEEVASHKLLKDGLQDAKCQYCGAPAVEGTLCAEIPGVMQEETQFWCADCRRDLTEFNSRDENVIRDFDIEDTAALDEEWRRGQERRRRQDDFMGRRVKERRRKENRGLEEEQPST